MSSNSNFKRGMKRGRRSFLSIILSGMLKNISITTWLIAVNTFFFVVSLFLGNFTNYLALQPRALFENYYAWTLITSMFMHAGVAHLFFNMFSLYFIGGFVEKIIGRKRFLWFYIISGIFAGLFFSVLSYFFGYGIGAKIFGSPDLLAVGASGAIFGLLGLLAVITPRKRVYLIAGPLVAIILQVVLESFITASSLLSLIEIIITLYIFISIFLIFSFNSGARKLALPIELEFWLLPVIAIVPLVVIGFFVQLPIGNMAHLGGLILGLGYGFYLRRKYAKKIMILNRYI